MSMHYSKFNRQASPFTHYNVHFQVGFKYTGRRCTADGCNGRLKDQVLDWEDALPEDELMASEEAAAEADLAICLGTSLQITPACNIPLKTTKAGKRLDKLLCNISGRVITHCTSAPWISVQMSHRFSVCMQPPLHVGCMLHCHAALRLWFALQEASL